MGVSVSKLFLNDLQIRKKMKMFKNWFSFKENSFECWLTKFDNNQSYCLKPAHTFNCNSTLITPVSKTQSLKQTNSFVSSDPVFSLDKINANRLNFYLFNAMVITFFLLINE